MNKLFSGSNNKNPKNEPIVVVSGLPRSGTSMMMRMLAEGGLPVITDELRRPDSDNPKGYFEFETVRQMSEGSVEWLESSGGKAVKVISALLEYLPPRYAYKIIFLCKLLDGEPRISHETLAVDFFDLDHLPPLSVYRTNEAMLQEVFAHVANPTRPAAFD